jgi:pimeloyl-ACP methyl ester carboxylesterase
MSEEAGTQKPVRRTLVWFDNSAHFPFLEEPHKFAEEMRKVAREAMVAEGK